MATQTNADRTSKILSRFHNFDDAVVRAVSLVVASSSGKDQAIIDLEAQAQDARPDSEHDGWLKVRLKVSDLREYRFVNDWKHSHYVLSLGLKLGHFDGLHYVDFGANTDEPDSLEDFRRSGFYLAGRELGWAVRPYPKSWLRKREKQPTL